MPKEICDWLSAAGTVAAVFVSLYVYRSTCRNETHKSILSAIERIIDIALQNPDFEKSSFCNEWRYEDREGADEKIRYNLYCCQVFNTIEQIYYYSGWRELGDKRKRMEKTFYYVEYIGLHWKWWETEVTMNGGYRDKFQRFIYNEILSLKKSGKIDISNESLDTLRR